MSKEAKQELQTPKISPEEKRRIRHQRLNSPQRQKTRKKIVKWITSGIPYLVWFIWYGLLSSKETINDIGTFIAWFITGSVIIGGFIYLLRLILLLIDTFLLPLEEVAEMDKKKSGLTIAILTTISFGCWFALSFIILNLTPILLPIFVTWTHQNASTWLAIIGIISGILGIVGGGGIIGMIKEIRDIQNQNSHK